MAFVKGKSGNPKGRPTKSRAWAELIARYGKDPVHLHDGTVIPAQDLIAQMTLEALTTGQVNFRRLKGMKRKPAPMYLGAESWIRFLNQTREHLEGGASLEIDLTSAGEAIQQVVQVYMPDNQRQKKDKKEE